MTKNVFYPSHPQSGHPLQDLKEILQKGLEMEIKQVSDHTKVSLQMERLVRNCRLKGINVFDFLKTTEYPLANVEDFELLDNEDNLVRDDIFKILKESGVGVPKYYEKVEYEINGKKGEYARSRSGCFFCFYQQKIEW